MEQNQPQQKPLIPQTAPAAQAGSTTARYAGMIVVGVIAGVVLAWGWSAWRSAPENPTAEGAGIASSTTKSGTGGGAAAAASSSLSIKSPQPAGTTVAIANAAVSAPTWVVIYENNAGKPGNALGAALFFPGSPSGTVELLRATLPGKTYLAARQVDNGDRKFSLKDDQLLVEGTEAQWVTFETK